MNDLISIYFCVLYSINKWMNKNKNMYKERKKEKTLNYRGTLAHKI